MAFIWREGPPIESLERIDGRAIDLGISKRAFLAFSTQVMDYQLDAIVAASIRFFIYDNKLAQGVVPGTSARE
jgi:hypothetical protein